MRQPGSGSLICSMVLIGGCFAAWPGQAGGQELLTNGGFEEFGDEGVPVDWSRYGGGVPESVLEPSADAREGERSLKLIDTGPNERDGRWAIGVFRTLDVQAGDQFVASVWVKALSRNHSQAVRLQLTFLPVSKTFAVDLAPPMDGEWHEFRTYGEAPEGAETLRVYIYTMHFWTSETLIDDASLKKADPAEFGDMLPLAAWSTLGPDAPRAVRRSWPLVADGKTVARIVAPDEAEYRSATEELASALGRWSDAPPPITLVPLPGPELREWAGHRLADLAEEGQTLVAIGNVNNNPICAHMYWNRCAFENSLFPGEGAYALRTVAEPYGLPDGSSAIVVGCSDAEGAKAGVRALIERMAVAATGRDLARRWTLVVSNAPPLSDAQREELLSGALKGEFVEFNRFAEQYLRTGHQEYAEAAKRALLACWDRYQDDPRRAVTWPEETNSNRIGSLWPAIEGSPIFTDEDRLTIARTVLVCLYSLPRHCSYWGRLADNETIIWNHTTFPLLGIYWLARYFQHAYPDLDPERMGMMMAEVRGAFRGQLKCWKPQCDADGYLTIVPRHTIEYTLAENDYTWFANGHARTYAEYLSTLADPRGTQPGLGDSGYTRSTTYETLGLPMAFWYYQDPRFLWRLNQTNQGEWLNPYHTDVQPVPWDEWAGVTVFPLHEEVYKYTIDRGYYDEGPAPPNVPIEQAFDKIAFRENLDEDGQYLLLDGYSRGKHLHWDGNSIIKFCDGGEDWLIDADYLVRNTTEHNMVSVLRDGRCDVYPPACAGLMHRGIFDGVAITQTALIDYNSTTWRRSLFWDRGNWFVVIDDVEAKEPGDYTVDCVWKTLREGTQELIDGRIFKTARWTGPRVGNYGLVTVADPEPGVQAAVRFTERESQLDFPIDLAAGEYVMTTWAYGLDTGTDSFWVQVDGGEEIPFHIPVGQFGPSSTAPTKDTPTPNITVAEDGRHRITLTLRENPGVMLDRVTIEDGEGNLIAEIQAEAAPEFAPGEIDMGPTRDFYVVGDGTAPSRFVDRTNHIGLEIRKLWQRDSSRVGAGESLRFINLLYTDTSDAPLGLDLHVIERMTALVTQAGEPAALVGVREAVDGSIAEAVGAPETDARLLMYTLSPTVVRLVDCTRWGEWLRAETPVTVELDFDQRLVRAGDHAPVEAELAGRALKLAPGGGASLAGWAEADRAAAEVREALRAAARVPEVGKEGPGPPPIEAGVPEGKVVWKAGPATGKPVRVLKTTDGIPDTWLLVAAGDEVMWTDESAEAVGGFGFSARVNDVCVADLDTADEQRYAEGPEIVVACDDESLYVLSSQGKFLRALQIDYPLRVGTSSVRQPRVSNVVVGDLEGTGEPSIIVGTLNGCLARLNTALERQWLFDRIEHGTREIRLADLDGDGVQEILAANKYGAVEIQSADGAALRGCYSELGDVEFDFGDVDGDGKLEIVNGSSTGALLCSEALGGEEWRFNNFGYAVLDVEIEMVDGQERTFVASETGYVYCLDGEGKVVNQVFLGQPVRRLGFLPAGAQEKSLVVAGCDGGEVYFLTTGLKPQGRVDLGARVTALLATDQGVVVGLVDGRAALVAPGSG